MTQRDSFKPKPSSISETPKDARMLREYEAKFGKKEHQKREDDYTATKRELDRRESLYLD